MTVFSIGRRTLSGARKQVRRTAIPLAALLAGLTLSGCNGTGPYVYWQEIATSYGGTELIQNMAARGTNMTVVRQNPFAGDSNDDAVFNVVQKSYYGRTNKFARGTPPADWNGHTFVLTFAESTIGSSNACRSADVPLLRAPAGRTAIIADYCIGQILVAEVKGWANGITGPEDPRLLDLVDGLLTEMFRYRVPKNEHGCGNAC